jgi:hypothetical protein
MSPLLAPIAQAVREFIAGGPYMPLWRAVMDGTEVIESSPISDAERQWFYDLYELVYMGAEDPVSGAERTDGLIGAADLRSRIKGSALDRFGAAPS